MHNMSYQSQKAPIGTTAKTGETCPESGIWKVQGGAAHETIPNTKGDRMPPYGGKAVTYVLVQYA